MDNKCLLKVLNNYKIMTSIKYLCSNALKIPSKSKRFTHLRASKMLKLCMN